MHMVFPAVATSSDPRSINLTDSLIKPSISFAVWALRLASVRTSLATTANPRPCESNEWLNWLNRMTKNSGKQHAISSGDYFRP
ncbi:hypothetical protein HMPREF9545_02445 [Escherichia coli MS 16-3]|nr:hypothetical protein HMPREF9545_02445 [Escherichia coli MS 16-3]